ncbi:hypothetical protein RHGRI_009432 [Rhododendron griersonianum]|uniref:pectinesterase n=1 Tax=Rhododendron griersonianum TaxID=479676 RepID=A0AAV6KFD5_9ERIC|nr:hypothetical protein RHGRI_009432 [Rhododendron griersonianum]
MKVDLENERLELREDGNRSRVIVVDLNGKGDSVTVQGAVDMVPLNNSQRVKIYISPGIYREKVLVPDSKPYISFIGDENRTAETVLTWNNKASDKDKDGCELGTYRSASVTIESDFFCATGITIENSVVAVPGDYGMQAVALRIASEKAMFYRDCVLHSTATRSGAIAAHHRDTQDDDTGFSFVNCTINGTGRVYLGRAWGTYSRAIYSYCDIDNIITPSGWNDWNQPSRQKTAVLGEYQCRGKGADRRNRVAWSKSFSYEEVRPFLDVNFIGGDQWLRL